MPPCRRYRRHLGCALLLVAGLVTLRVQVAVLHSRRDYLTDRLGLPRGFLRAGWIEPLSRYYYPYVPVSGQWQWAEIRLFCGKQRGLALSLHRQSRWALASKQPGPLDAATAEAIARDAVVRYLGADPAAVQIVGPATWTTRVGSLCEVALMLTASPQRWIPPHIRVVLHADGRVTWINALRRPDPWPPPDGVPLPRTGAAPPAPAPVADPGLAPAAGG